MESGCQSMSQDKAVAEADQLLMSVIVSIVLVQTPLASV